MPNPCAIVVFACGGGIYSREGNNAMQRYIAAATVILLIALVLSRVALMKKLGISAFKFGKMDKKDFLIPPFALLFFYIVFAGAFSWPTLGAELFGGEIVRWAGAALCLVGLLLFLFSLISFGRSFRVGIDEEHPGTLVTSGVFAFSRNPIYTAFGLILLGIFLIVPNWILLLYLAAGFWLFNRQVLLEEASLKKIYGKEYLEYCKKVRRYL
jgi:protein-S-isoprenylcysteine O-methyltransferase Ste14